MKKILSIFAISAIVLGMASCGGDEPAPQAKKIQLEVTALSTKTRIVATASNPNADFYTDYLNKALIDEKYNGSIESYINELFAETDIEDLKNYFFFKEQNVAKTTLNPSTEYVAFACYVKVNGDKAEIDGEIFSKEFKTLEQFTLNGKFSIGSGRTVRFCTSNLFHYSTYTCEYDQSMYEGENGPDLHQWSITGKHNADTRVLTSFEWWQILRGRNRASELFAHATITNGASQVRGLLILPDNWQTPEGIKLYTAQQMGLKWDETDLKYEVPTTSVEDCYDINTYDIKIWEELEFAGAVFLPAAEKGNTIGNYWSSTETAVNTAHGFHFDKNTVQLKALQSASMQKTASHSIRLAWTGQ